MFWWNASLRIPQGRKTFNTGIIEEDIEPMVTQMMIEQIMTSAGDAFRQFMPSEQGKSLDEQIYPWNVEGISEKMQPSLSPDEADPKTISNILIMRAVEMQHWADYHSYATMIADENFKKLLNAIAWAEHLHHLKLESLLPTPDQPAQSVLMSEVALMMGYERCIEKEPHDTVRNIFEHIWHDHKQHAEFAAQSAQQSGVDIDKMTGGMDLSGGRPLQEQFMRPDDTIWQGETRGIYKKDSVDAQTLINIDLSAAVERAAFHDYACAFVLEKDKTTKLHFGAFQSVEDQHISILGSLRDPSETILERTLLHEQVEMKNYHKMMEQESNPRVRQVFEDLYREDMEHARLFGRIAG